MGVQACPREFRNKAGRLGSEGENSFPCFGRGGGGVWNQDGLDLKFRGSWRGR